MRRIRKGLDPAWVAQASDPVQRSALELDEFKRARVVACYLAAPGEVQTDKVLETCWQTGRRVCVPSYKTSHMEYSWAFLDRGHRLKPGPWRIPEPETPAMIGDTSIDFAVVPGLAFDRCGNRLGYGRGFYDRLLAGLDETLTFKLGFIFSCQVVESLPALAHDVVMDAVATETGIFRRNRPAHGRDGE